MTYTVIYEKGTCVPDLPGVITVGDLREEVEQLIQETIEFHLCAATFAGTVDVNPAA